MKYIKTACLLMISSAIVLCGCDEDTGSIGIFPEEDAISNSSAVYQYFTRSIAMDSVLCNSYTSFLGNIRDPETGTHIQASFASQFHTFENFKLPEKRLMFPAGTNYSPSDPVHCDSCEIRLYFNSYYGLGDTPMKLEVYQLDENNILEEDKDYYSNTDLSQFVKKGAEPIATKIFTPLDYTISDAERTSSKHTDNVRIVLPAEYGSQIMNTFYAHPEYFRNSYEFIRHVCPGFYFKLKSGVGTMLNISVGTLNIYFKYFDEHQTDSVYQGLSRFAATAEVIQTTQFETEGLRQLVDDPSCTYLKTPAGIGTLIELPVKEIYRNHETDSVSKARLTLTRFNRSETTESPLGIPTTLLMVRKQNMRSFFSQRQVTDQQTSFTTTYSSALNTYSFDNLARLISYCQHEKTNGMKQSGMTEEQWEAANPDWNKVVVIPVKTSSTTDQYGSNRMVSVTHDMGMNSVRLVGGPNTPLDMQVIYSRFK